MISIVRFPSFSSQIGKPFFSTHFNFMPRFSHWLFSRYTTPLSQSTSPVPLFRRDINFRHVVNFDSTTSSLFSMLMWCQPESVSFLNQQPSGRLSFVDDLFQNSFFHSSSHRIPSKEGASPRSDLSQEYQFRVANGISENEDLCGCVVQGQNTHGHDGVKQHDQDEEVHFKSVIDIHGSTSSEEDRG